MNEIMSLQEFADFIKVHPNTVRNMIRNRIIAAFKVGKGRNSAYRIAKSETLRLPLANLRNLLKEEK